MCEICQIKGAGATAKFYNNTHDISETYLFYLSFAI